jgi:hypothetical protein
MLAMAVVVLNREVSTVPGLGGGSSVAAAPTNQEALRTAASPHSALTSRLLLLVVIPLQQLISISQNSKNFSHRIGVRGLEELVLQRAGTDSCTHDMQDKSD